MKRHIHYVVLSGGFAVYSTHRTLEAALRGKLRAQQAYSNATFTVQRCRADGLASQCCEI